jgi:hypothetical protein
MQITTNFANVTYTVALPQYKKMLSSRAPGSLPTALTQRLLQTGDRPLSDSGQLTVFKQALSPPIE